MLVILAAALPLALPTVPATAATLDCDQALDEGAVRCVADESWIRVSEMPGAGASDWPPEGWRLVTYVTYDTDDDGEACLREITRYLAPSEPLPVGETAPWFEFNHPSSPPDDIDWGECPPRTRDAPPDLDLMMEHVTAELRRRLPAPQLSVAPGGTALTGLPAHLDTGARDLTMSDVLSVSDGDWDLAVRFEAAGRYRVDWGDGAGESGPFTVAGRPYPHGEVRHAYRASGDHRMRVVDDWDVLVEVPGLPPLPLAYEIGYPPLELRVESLRAVRVASR